LENVDELKRRFEEYCEEHIKDGDIEKSVSIDTKIYPHERTTTSLNHVYKLAPFGEGNKEPLFLLEKVTIHKIEKV